MSPTAPKKYLDRDRVQVNPAWLQWRDNELREAPEKIERHILQQGYELGVYMPEREGKAIPEEGAWIIVVEEPHTELKRRFRIPPLSMWRARHHELNDGGLQIHKGLSVRPQQAVIATPGGDLHLWAHEYVVVKDPLELIASDGATMHHLGGENAIDSEQLFYLQSRGIGYREAVLLLFDSITSNDYLYVTFPKDITDALEGAGQSLRRHIALHPRGQVNA